VFLGLAKSRIHILTKTIAVRLYDFVISAAAANEMVFLHYLQQLKKLSNFFVLVMTAMLSWFCKIENFFNFKQLKRI
jgi:hypothetical protein